MLSGSVLSGQAGLWLVFITVNALVWEETESALAVTGIHIAQTAPMLLCAVPAGMLADRFSRKWLMVTAKVIAALAILILGFVISGERGTLGFLFQIYGVLFVVWSVTVLFELARDSLLPSLVHEYLLVRANSVVALSAEAMAMVGPAVAGLAASQLGSANTLFLGGRCFSPRWSCAHWTEAWPGARQSGLCEFQ